MRITCLFATLLLVIQASFAQPTLGQLTVEKIMRDPRWMGSSPSAPQWTADGKYLFFKWNPENVAADSFYYITLQNLTPAKATPGMIRDLVFVEDVRFNALKTAYVYSKNGDIFITTLKDGTTKRITQTADYESDAQFSFNGNKVVYQHLNDLFSWDINTGVTTQLTRFVRASAPPKEDRKEGGNPQEKWLINDQLGMMEVLAQRKAKNEITDSINKKNRSKELRTIYTEDRVIRDLSISSSGRFISYRLQKTSNASKSTNVPTYVTETGFTTDIASRTKVGEVPASSETYIFDTEKDTVILVKTDGLPGIKDLPDYVKDYPAKDSASIKKPGNRGVTISSINWNADGSQAFADIYSQDNKDRWIMMLDPVTGKLSMADRQRDEAWIGGPGISSFRSQRGWINNHVFWFKSEATGYSHLYTFDIYTKTKAAVTSGNFEVQEVYLSNDKKTFYISTNEVHPGELQVYKLPITGGKPERITTMTGSNQVFLSPDQQQAAILYSYSNKPWELYIQKNEKSSVAKQVTDKAASAEFKSYAWRDPALISFKAKDGAMVYARVYKPANPDPHKPAVIFVHGAGYLQNAHKWWSSYFREYMFNNLLTDLGYTVMDVDYRGSAGYGRNWRTGIYRHMGGRDLDDEMDAAQFLVDSLGINKDRIGMYGGSYGGFMTLMAMFTKPDVIKAGAALRSVTDWAHYNHGYTSAILNEPFTDSLAYKRSSPIYFAAGLKNRLLICHGMVDVNVHFQDDVRLVQRLIELGKENWEIAIYPMEDHGFVEPSSWTDEYKRILKLFETELKK